MSFPSSIPPIPFPGIIFAVARAGTKPITQIHRRKPIVAAEKRLSLVSIPRLYRRTLSTDFGSRFFPRHHSSDSASDPKTSVLWPTGARTGARESPFGCRNRAENTKAPDLRGFSMRPNGVEPHGCFHPQGPQAESAPLTRTENTRRAKSASGCLRLKPAVSVADWRTTHAARSGAVKSSTLGLHQQWGYGGVAREERSGRRLMDGPVPLCKAKYGPIVSGYVRRFRRLTGALPAHGWAEGQPGLSFKGSIRVAEPLGPEARFESRSRSVS